ncbi:MAG: hypothetical protein ACTHU0_38665 [Kofleriaceae bacterium]
MTELQDRSRRQSLKTCVYLVLFVALVACGGEPVGRICDLGDEMPKPSDVVIASPSLDCVTRTCLRVPLGRELPPGSTFPTGTSGLCTAECSSDDDCERVPESPCVTGFTCGVAVPAGPFCCRKFCICKDYVVVPDSGELSVPAACDPSNPLNKCCNLEGRAGNPDYPHC